jgi:NADH:ubiquinone oxidoreductase subunit H
VLSVLAGRSPTYLILWILIIYLKISIRGAYPRYRLDRIIELCWLIYLPFTLILLRSFYLLCASNSPPMMKRKVNVYYP